MRSQARYPQLDQVQLIGSEEDLKSRCLVALNGQGCPGRPQGLLQSDDLGLTCPSDNPKSIHWLIMRQVILFYVVFAVIYN